MVTVYGGNIAVVKLLSILSAVQEVGVQFPLPLDKWINLHPAQPMLSMWGELGKQKKLKKPVCDCSRYQLNNTVLMCWEWTAIVP